MILAAVFHDDPSQRTFANVSDVPVSIGRKPASNTNSPSHPFPITWSDRVINRNHSIAVRQGDQLVVDLASPLPGEKGSKPNPFYSNSVTDKRVRLNNPLRLNPGDSFVIGAQGRTSFYWLRNVDELERLLSNDSQFAEPRHRDFERTKNPTDDYDHALELDEYSMRLQLRLLQKELPEKVLRGWTDEEDLFTRACDFLQSALPGQKAVSAAFIALQQNDPELPFDVLHKNTSSLANFRPSRTLIRQVLDPDAKHDQAFVWSSDESDHDIDGHSFVGQVDWVVALPLASLERNAPIYHDSNDRPVYLYVETRQASNASARAYLPFLRLIASLVSSLLTARQQQRVQDQMSAYFSPALRRHFKGGESRALELTVCDCTVLFCDRRASSQHLERARSDDALLENLRDNQEFVSKITDIVFDRDGVITDFAGDGLLALWGWPKPDNSAGPSHQDADAASNHALQAINTAEAIATALADRVELDQEQNPMAAFRVGISTGRVAVGKTGPRRQMHISVFGSVVNFGARLEGLGKQFHVPVLLSEETALLVRDQGKFIRKLCYLKPAGFNQAYPIYELAVPRNLGGSGATQESIDQYENALAAFVDRQWGACLALIDKLPKDDEPARWLERQVDHFQNSPPPEGWAGEIVALSK
ncbi:MAG: adenylate/guanylate cyclase domain-containing protein [Verrucomicrobiota bacterium]